VEEQIQAPDIQPTHTATFKNQTYKAVEQSLSDDDNIIKVIEKYIIHYKKGSAILRLHRGSFSKFWTVVSDDDRKATFNFHECKVEKFVDSNKKFMARFWIIFNRNGREYSNLIEKVFKGKDEDDIRSMCHVRYAHFGARIYGDMIIEPVKD
jgi:hypothetical protein